LIGNEVKVHMQQFLGWTRHLLPKAKALGPYVLVELILPGGSLIALGLWLYHHRGALAARFGAKATA
jgi:hypothetical protein